MLHSRGNVLQRDKEEPVPIRPGGNLVPSFSLPFSKSNTASPGILRSSLCECSGRLTKYTSLQGIGLNHDPGPVNCARVWPERLQPCILHSHPKSCFVDKFIVRGRVSCQDSTDSVAAPALPLDRRLAPGSSRLQRPLLQWFPALCPELGGGGSSVIYRNEQTTFRTSCGQPAWEIVPAWRTTKCETYRPG